MRKPIVAVPMGDPAGIGPEIVLKSFSDPGLQDARILVVGDINVLGQIRDIVGAGIELKHVRDAGEVDYTPGQMPILDVGGVDMSRFRFGEISAMCGQAAYDCIAKCIELAMAAEVDAVATPPISKEALHLAGIGDIGHTEIFAKLTQSEDPLTMFQVQNLRVFFLTRHMSLRQACDLVTKDRIIDYVKRCTEALERLDVNGRSMASVKPMAIAGLNPHSGENGLFGDEEMREILPAVEALRGEGYAVEGPVSADSVFHLANGGRYSSVLSLYHDQGHIACKTLDFERTVAITCGMPIMRTSVDHGTAFDIAGRGVASPVSMVEAIKTAQHYAPYIHA